MPQMFTSSGAILSQQNQHFWHFISLLVSEDTSVPAFLMDSNYYDKLFLSFVKENINNFQDILQHRNDPDLNHSTIHCSCFLTSPNLQEILLDVETCPAQIPNPSHGYHCEIGEQNPSICAANLH